jgi:peptide-methionine (S)-S-oxide reductase
VLFSRTKSNLPGEGQALAGRDDYPYPVPERHAVLGTPLRGPFPPGLEVISFGMGCFWGAERRFWQVEGVYSTAAGYQGGTTTYPTYEETCTGRTGHTEAVQVVYDPTRVYLHELLKVFWETHDPTQLYRQGNDIGTQYRSAVYWTTPEQKAEIDATRDSFQKVLTNASWGDIATEIAPAGPFYYAEDYHQQYLYKVPHGYDCHSATGLRLPD